MREVRGAFTERIAAFFLGLVFPTRCPLCGANSGSAFTSPICSACWGGILPYEGPACGICAKPLSSGHAETCGECLKERPPYARAVSYGVYTETLKEAIHLMKFKPVKRLSRPLGALLKEMDLPRADFVVPVPLSLEGLRQRGFNQTLLLSRVAAERLGVPVEAHLLYKKKDTPPQVGLSRRARTRNLRGAFGVRRKLGGDRVLLIDDVITTGATVSECSKALLRAGAKKVSVASLARA